MPGVREKKPDCRNTMKAYQNSTFKFAICVKSDDPDLLTPHIVYRILPDEKSEKSNYIRVIDNEGEDYLYPADWFSCC